VELLREFLISFWTLTLVMAPFIIAGLFIAGILHEVVPFNFIKKHLGRNDISSVIKSTILGIPLPVCSCGVIPLAASLKKEGASKGAVLSFLISTPITGIDSILATFGIFGPFFTFYRVGTSVIIAFVSGILSNIFEKKEPKFKAVALKNISLEPLVKSSNLNKNTTKSFSIKRALKYGFVTLMRDIAKSLFWGLLIGALITVAIPSDFESILSSHMWLGYVGAILIALPMYVCATSSLPIAASLVLNGVSLGAAFVFLTAGPATNTVTMGVVKRMLGKRTLFIYLITIALGSLLFGLILDIFFHSIDPKNLIVLDDKVGLIDIASSIILYILIIYFISESFFKKERKSCCSA